MHVHNQWLVIFEILVLGLQLASWVYALCFYLDIQSSRDSSRGFVCSCVVSPPCLIDRCFCLCGYFLARSTTYTLVLSVWSVCPFMLLFVCLPDGSQYYMRFYMFVVAAWLPRCCFCLLRFMCAVCHRASFSFVCLFHVLHVCAVFVVFA